MAAEAAEATSIFKSRRGGTASLCGAAAAAAAAAAADGTHAAQLPWARESTPSPSPLRRGPRAPAPTTGKTASKMAVVRQQRPQLTPRPTVTALVTNIAVTKTSLSSPSYSDVGATTCRTTTRVPTRATT